MLPAAFVPVGHATSEDRSKLHFSEGSETQGELDLRERKSAILKMFEVLGLKPQAEAIQRRETGRRASPECTYAAW